MNLSEKFEKALFKLLPNKGEKIEEGKHLPVFELQNQEGETVSSSEIENALIYFYPKAGTSGCTKQACNLRDNISKLKELDLDVYGISVDTVEDQKQFHNSEDLNFDLLADKDGKVAEKFGVLSSTGVSERTSFIVKDGKIEKVFRNIGPTEHIEKVLEHLR